jgi:hypothetical protein
MRAFGEKALPVMGLRWNLLIISSTPEDVHQESMWVSLHIK